jgi:hypothetical protein
MRRLASSGIGLVVAGALIGLVLGVHPGSARTVNGDPQVAMGAHLFVQFACAACHGEQGSAVCRNTCLP